MQGKIWLEIELWYCKLCILYSYERSHGLQNPFRFCFILSNCSLKQNYCSAIGDIQWNILHKVIIISFTSREAVMTPPDTSSDNSPDVVRRRLSQSQAHQEGEVANGSEVGGGACKSMWGGEINGEQPNQQPAGVIWLKHSHSGTALRLWMRKACSCSWLVIGRGTAFST